MWDFCHTAQFDSVMRISLKALIVSFIHGPRLIFARQEDDIVCDVGFAK